MSAEERQVRAAHSTWIDAVNAGDLDQLLTLMSADAVFLSPGTAPSGRSEFSAHFTAAKREIRFSCVSELEEVVVADDVAFTRSRDSLSVMPIVGTGETQFAGHRITVYRKQPDGRWLLARDAHTLSPVEK